MRRRVSLAMLMGLVALVAVGLAMMKVATEGIARGVVLLSFVALLSATVGSVVRRRDRPAWIGTVVFGWGYLILIVATAFMDVESGSHGNPGDIWRVADVAIEVGERLHPEPPMLFDPLANIATGFDTSGRPVKMIDNQQIPLTPDDLKTRADFQINGRLHHERDEAFANATTIGLAIQGLAFALIGGVAGHVLSDRSTNAAASPGAEPFTLPG